MTEKNDALSGNQRVEKDDDRVCLWSIGVEMGVYRPSKEVLLREYLDQCDQ